MHPSSVTHGTGQRQNASVRQLPSVTIVIPNWNGAEHLPDCLDAIRVLDYPQDRLEVVVVDNGSTDGSRSVAESRLPGIRVVELASNEGFGAACNAGVREARSECVAFINNDMRADRAWLRQLVEAYDPADGYVCVGGVILSWDGTRLDFVEGTINFHAFGWQEHFEKPASEALIDDGSDLLFACGGSMLISRDVYLDLRGFDAAYFAYYEDVDLGWRLWLAGYKVRLAGGARVFHRHHGSASALPSRLPSFLYERNALSTLIKNLSDENLARVMTPALLLLVQKAVIVGGLASEPFDMRNVDLREGRHVAPAGLVPLYAVYDVLSQLPDLIERRRHVQRRRRRNDNEIFELFFRPFTPWMHDERYLEASILLRDVFALDRLFPHQRATRVLVVGDGAGERDQHIAGHLMSANSVTLWPRDGHAPLRDLLAESDLVIASSSTRHADTIAAETRGLLVVDVAGDELPRDSQLFARADVLIGDAPDVTPIEQLTAIVRQPWRWRRTGSHVERIPIPEDLQWLLHVRREPTPRRDSDEPAVQAGSLPRRTRHSVGQVLRRLGLRT
jgi:GT2 family glycosyltransferase